VNRRRREKREDDFPPDLIDADEAISSGGHSLLVLVPDVDGRDVYLQIGVGRRVGPGKRSQRPPSRTPPIADPSTEADPFDEPGTEKHAQVVVGRGLAMPAAWATATTPRPASPRTRST
jgi:hypothetical protein